MKQAPSKATLPRQQLQVFAEVFKLGGDLGPRANADVSAVLRLLAAARPNLPQIVAAEARLRLQARDVSGARNLVEDAERANPGNPLLKAMLALTLFMQGDGLWHAYAEEARALPDSGNAHAIVDAIERAVNNTQDEPAAATNDAEDAAPSMVLPMGLAC